MKSILYIEDNPLNMRIVKKHLKRTRIELLEATDGFMGLDMALVAQPDVILLDINLPDIDGLEVTRQLRSRNETAHIPIIAITANAMHGDRELCLDSGCDAYIAKPLARQELYNTLRAYMPEEFQIAIQ